MQRSLTRILGGTLIALGAITGAALPAAASPGGLRTALDPLSTWCWSMQGRSLTGTFTLTPAIPGDGTAPAGTYTITGFTVDSSVYPAAPVGSVADGTYIFGTQPDYTIEWNGSAATSWNRASGTFTNGIGIYRFPPEAVRLLFHNIAQGLEDASGAIVFESAVPPEFAPVPASGLCPAPAVVVVEPAPAPVVQVPSPSPSTPGRSLAETGGEPASGLIPAALLALGGLVLGLARLRIRRG